MLNLGIDFFGFFVHKMHFYEHNVNIHTSYKSGAKPPTKVKSITYQKMHLELKGLAKKSNPLKTTSGFLYAECSNYNSYFPHGFSQCLALLLVRPFAFTPFTLVLNL